MSGKWSVKEHDSWPHVNYHGPPVLWLFFRSLSGPTAFNLGWESCILYGFSRVSSCLQMFCRLYQRRGVTWTHVLHIQDQGRIIRSIHIHIIDIIIWELFFTDHIRISAGAIPIMLISVIKPYHNAIHYFVLVSKFERTHFYKASLQTVYYTFYCSLAHGSTKNWLVCLLATHDWLLKVPTWRK